MYIYKPFKQTISVVLPWTPADPKKPSLSDPERSRKASQDAYEQLGLSNKTHHSLVINLIGQCEEIYDPGHGGPARATCYTFDVSYELLVWNGPTSGVQTVHKRVFSRTSALTACDTYTLNSIVAMEIESGVEFVQKRIPEAVYRVDHSRRYGPGPDLRVVTTQTIKGDIEILYEVDFDFGALDSRES